MTLVGTREKLKPFVDEGVVHKDRKRDTNKAVEGTFKPKKGGNLEERINDYKILLFEYI